MGVVLKQDPGSAINPAEVMHILAFQRAPWHYVPWLWPAGTWIRFIGFALLAGIARWRAPRVPWLDWLVISIMLFCVLGLAGFFIRPLVSTIILQPFRMMVFFQLAGALYLGCYIWGLFSDPGALRRVVGTLLLAALLMGQWYTDSFFLVLAVLMLLFEASQYLQRRFSTPTVGRWLCALIPMIIVLTLIVYGVSLLRERDDLVSTLLALGSMGLTIISVYAQQRTHYQRLTLATAGLAIFIMGGLLGAAWAGVASRSWLRRITRNLDVQIQRNSLCDQVGGWARLHTAPDATS
jgi:hypothetical protein